MDGAQNWPIELVTELIAAYRDNPCLWKITDKAYLNRNLKNEAYKTLVDKCKQHFPGANRDFVSKKIQSLRGSFRKEFKKVIASKRSGTSTDDVYVPKLWYYDLLSFTIDCETPAGSVDNIGTDVTPEIQEKELSEPDGTVQRELLAEDQPVTNTSSKAETSKSQGTANSKRSKKRSYEESQLEFMQTFSKALTESTEVSEFDAVGMVVSKKLQRMNPVQAMLAEEIINSVLCRGLRNQLTESSEIIDRTQTTDHESSRSSFDSNEFSRSSLNNPSPVSLTGPILNHAEQSRFFPSGLYDEGEASQSSYTSL